MSIKKDNCPARSVESTLKVITKRWSLQILFDLFCGKSHFNEFKEGKPKLLNTTLSRCLQDLEEEGLIKKTVDNKDKNNTEYFLTDEGRLLNKVIYELMVYAFEKDTANELYSQGEKKLIIEKYKEPLDID